MELLNLPLSTYFLLSDSCYRHTTDTPTEWRFVALSRGGSRHKDVQSRSTSAEVKNAWSYTSRTPYAYVFKT